MSNENTKTCAQCGTEFTSYPSANRKFCSRRCFELSHRKPFDRKPCVVCGTEIVPHARDMASTYSKRKACSTSCLAILNGRPHIGKTPHNKKPPLPAATCATCGKSFTPTSRSHANKYCSMACHLTKLHEANKNVERKPKVPMVCQQCGNEFLVYPSNVVNRRYCSRACMAVVQRTITGPDHPLYKPKVEMACEVCGTTRMVKPSVVSTFRACSKRCAAVLGIESMKRGSSLEVAVATELDRLGITYRRQHRIRWYVVDFFIPERNLVLEADGSYWHSLPKQRRRDAAKDGYMRTHGISIVHISEVAIKTDVVDAVRKALAA